MNNFIRAGAKGFEPLPEAVEAPFTVLLTTIVFTTQNGL